MIVIINTNYNIDHISDAKTAHDCDVKHSTSYALNNNE